MKYEVINYELFICFIFSFPLFEIPQSMPYLERYYMYFDGRAFLVAVFKDLTYKYIAEQSNV